ncbi:hypothetical protein [Lacticaseibacillus hulanensis]|uniref:hypothetical protein n=1 Tax=Lacticaseibacillus hulanensis TaxID=2493111 RepID=UPI000FDBEDF9|nr:hypothetical protein [Lacticaseibacillus hulanensis]
MADDELVSIKRSDLQQMIADSIAQALTKKKPTTPQALFAGVAIDDSEIRTINERHGIETGSSHSPSHNCAVYRRSQYEDAQGFSRDEGPFEREIHEPLKRLAMMVCGETKNSNVARVDFDRVRDNYSQFRDLFVKLYDDRLAGIAKERRV